MQINSDTRFPQPVLSEESGDFADREFIFNVPEAAEDSTKQILSLTYNYKITDDNLNTLITDGKADLVIFVTCKDTYYRTYIKLEPKEDMISFDPGVLNGTVLVQPLIVSSEKIEDFKSPYLHEEYGGSYTYEENQIMAFAPEIVVPVGRDKLAPMHSIFSLALDEELKDAEVKVLTESDKITILTSANTQAKMALLRSNSMGKAILLNSIYLPAIMEVLNSLKDPSITIQEHRWYPVFMAKCQSLGINTEDPNLFEDAQKLLKRPFGVIEKQRELSE